MTDKRLTPPADYFVGKCQSCRHAMQRENKGAAGGVLLYCHDIPFNEPELTRPNWTCGFYDYGPGSLG